MGVSMSGNQLEFDVIILGCGPAGLQAATHAARAKAEVAVLGRVHRSSLYKAHVENYCCMDATLSGMEILEQGKHQAEKFGAHFFEDDVLGIDREENDRFVIHLENGQTLAAWAEG
jgi:thioredoxin reductase (NADPH)